MITLPAAENSEEDPWVPPRGTSPELWTYKSEKCLEKTITVIRERSRPKIEINKCVGSKLRNNPRMRRGPVESRRAFAEAVKSCQEREKMILPPSGTGKVCVSFPGTVAHVMTVHSKELAERASSLLRSYIGKGFRPGAPEIFSLGGLLLLIEADGMPQWEEVPPVSDPEPKILIGETINDGETVISTFEMECKRVTGDLFNCKTNKSRNEHGLAVKKYFDKKYRLEGKSTFRRYYTSWR